MPEEKDLEQKKEQNTEQNPASGDENSTHNISVEQSTTEKTPQEATNPAEVQTEATNNTDDTHTLPQQDGRQVATEQGNEKSDQAAEQKKESILEHKNELYDANKAGRLSEEAQKSFAKKGFESAQIDQLNIKDNSKNEYHIYSSKDDFVSVDAKTVVEAIKMSKIDDPHKVFHANCRLRDIIIKEELINIANAGAASNADDNTETDSQEQVNE